MKQIFEKMMTSKIRVLGTCVAVFVLCWQRRKDLINLDLTKIADLYPDLRKHDIVCR